MINYNKPEHLRYTEGFTKLLPPPKAMEKSLVFKNREKQNKENDNPK